MSTDPLEATTTLDRADTRVQHDDSIGGAFRAFLSRLRSGDLGVLPVAIGLVLITVVFTALNPVFIAPNNLVNLLFDCALVGFIALGVVCVLLLGEIDLAIGSMAGLASAIVGVLWVQLGLPIGVAILAALAAGMLAGTVYALLLTHLGMPSFISTLAGLLALLGMQLYILGSTGSINLPYASPFVHFGQLAVMPEWFAALAAFVPGVVILWTRLRVARKRRDAGLAAGSLTLLIVRVVVITAALEAAVWYLNLGRGVPWMFGLFVLAVVALDYALRRTKWGRSMFAIGGNREAARRAGINIRRITLSAFVLCSTFAAVGGVLMAARLASSSRQAGTGDVNLNAIAAAVIGGTSLFGGRGSAWSALLGILVIQAISNGLTLLNLSSSLRYMITGGVLAIAVIVDSLARQSRQTHGRG